MLNIILSLLVFFHGSSVFAEIIFDSKIEVSKASKTVLYSFELKDDSSVITDKDLIETHTKLLHLVVYDLSLKEFNHVHPEFNGTEWVATLNLPVNGKYFVWAQGETTQGIEFSVSKKLIIQDGLKANPIVALGDVRIGTDGTTQLKLANNKIKAGKMMMLDFAISRTDGSSPNLSPYLGAFAHVISVSPVENELIHVHPMAGSKTNTGMIHATFPAKGEYRLWVQFNDDDQLKTIALSVVVE